MNILKKFGLGALTIGMAFGLSMTSVNARSLGYKIGGADVEDVTTTVCVEHGGTLRSFGNGVSMDQVWALERESGSKGSGAWAAVKGHEDIFPTANGAAAVLGPTQVDDYTSEGPGCYRLRMTSDAGGTAQVQIVADGSAPTADSVFTQSSHLRSFDDFQHGTLPITTTHNGDTPSYVVFIGSGNAAVLSVIESEGEGAMTFSNGDSGTDDTDLSVGSLGLIGHGSLVSDGLTAVEFRASVSAITDVRMNLALVDRIQAATEEEPYQINTGVVVEGNSAAHANSIGFVFDTDSADAQTDMWNMASLNANTLGNASDEYTLGVSPVASTYARFRIEVDSAGNGFMYYNGDLVGVEPLAVATTAVLIPTWALCSPDDGTGTVRKGYLDYLLWYVPRPSTVS
jgi:hypothetical protein